MKQKYAKGYDVRQRYRWLSFNIFTVIVVSFYVYRDLFIDIKLHVWKYEFENVNFWIAFARLISVHSISHIFHVFEARQRKKMSRSVVKVLETIKYKT